jgi:hypothetical protein
MPSPPFLRAFPHLSMAMCNSGIRIQETSHKKIVRYIKQIREIIAATTIYNTLIFTAPLNRHP